MKNLRKLLGILILITTLLISTISVSAQPTAEIEISPEDPVRLDTVTFTATITSDEEIDEVVIEVIECDASDICYRGQEETMELVGNVYVADVTLEHEDTSYFQYQCKITIGEEITETGLIKQDVTAENGDNGDDNGDNGDDNGGGIPGFELVIFIFAIAIAFILIRRKR